MKHIGVMTLMTVLLFMSVVPAAGDDGGVYINPIAELLLLPFAVAATITVGVATVLTAPFAYAGAPPPAVYAYPYTYAAPVFVYPAPPTPSYWYYCASARIYYPYVSTCPEGWMRVLPRVP